MRREVFLEPLGDPVVLPHEDDVQGGEERLLVGPAVARHEVLRLVRPQLPRVRPEIQLLPRGKLVRVGIPLQAPVLISPIHVKSQMISIQIPTVTVHVPQNGGGFDVRPVHHAGVDKGRDFVVLRKETWLYSFVLPKICK